MEEIAKIFDGEDAVVRSGLELTKKNFKITQKEIRLAQMMMLDTNSYKFALFYHIITINSINREKSIFYMKINILLT